MGRHDSFSNATSTIGLAAATWLAFGMAQAGSVPMNFSSNAFSDPVESGGNRCVNCNVGDHVVWGGAFAPVVAAGHSIEFCGTPADQSGRWFGHPAPNFSGAEENCLTPTRSTTWRRNQTLYR